VVVCSAALSAHVRDGGVVQQLTAIARNSVIINCYNYTESSTPPRRVEWLSNAWSRTHDPLRIFTSHSNPGFSVEPHHPNAENYAVDSQYRLTMIQQCQH